MTLIDTHAHLDFVEDLENVLENAESTGVTKIITIGTSIEASKKSIAIAEKYSSDNLKIYATCGIHPEDGKKDVEKFGSYLEELKKVAQSSSKVIGIGETGLDYYLSGNQRPVTSKQDKEFQRELFRDQIGLASDLNLPLVVHCRHGWDEIFDLITKSQIPNSKSRGVFHSWTGDWKKAQRALALGFYISFSGIATFKNASDVQDVARKIPLKRMVVETDSPFLTPEPLKSGDDSTSPSLRGVRKNEPKNVKIIAEFLASLRQLPPDKISEITTGNTLGLFRL